MNLSQGRQLRQLVLCLAAAFLTSSAFAATYEMRMVSKGLVSPLTNPVIGAVAPWSVEFGTPAFRIPTPESNSSGVFSYRSNTPSVVTVNGDVVSLVGVGTALITATQAADARHNAGSLQISLQVVGAVPSLGGFPSLSRTFGSGSFALTPPSSASTGSFSYVSSNPAVAQVSGSNVNILGAGSTTITASQATAGNYVGASTSAVLTVSKALPVIDAWSIPAKQTVDGPFNLVTPTSTSSGAFTYVSSNPAVATVTGSTVTLNGPGTATITASQAASSNFSGGAAAASLTVSPPPLPSGYFTLNGVTWTPRTTQGYPYDNAVAYCAGTSFNGATGWRLPTLAEHRAAQSAGLLTGVNINTWNAMNNGQYTYSQTLPGNGTGYVHPDGGPGFTIYCVKSM